MNNGANITWVKGEEFCRWKGMHHEECTKLIGTDGELEIDEPDFVLISGVAYCDSPAVMLEVARKYQENLWKDITEVKSLLRLRAEINIDLLREFSSDLNDYYANPKKYEETDGFKETKEPWSPSPSRAQIVEIKYDWS